MRRAPLALPSLLALLLAAGCGQADSAVRNTTSPAAAATTSAVTGEVATDYDVAPTTPEALALVKLPLKDASGKDIKGPKVTVKVQVPDDEWQVIVDGGRYKGTGKERDIKVAALPEGKDHYIVRGLLVPNNYTWRIRSRKVYPKGAKEVAVDLTKEDPKNKDHIEVRFVPTPDDMIEAMCKIGKVTPKDVVYDLGCGDGRIVIYAIKKYHAKRGVGIDIDPARIKEAKEKADEAGVAQKVEFRVGDVLKIKDLQEANVVMLYMGDDINLRLRPILKKTLRPGSRVVSHRFTMGDWKPDKTQYLSKPPDPVYAVHLWVIGGQGEAGKKEGAGKEGAGAAGNGQVKATAAQDEGCCCCEAPGRATISVLRALLPGADNIVQLSGAARKGGGPSRK